MKRGVAQRGLNASDETGYGEFRYFAYSFCTINHEPTVYAPYLRCVSLIWKGLAKGRCTYVDRNLKVKKLNKSIIS